MTKDEFLDKLDDLSNTINEIELEVRRSSEAFTIPPSHDNVMTRGTIEALFENLPLVPMDKLKEFIDNCKM